MKTACSIWKKTGVLVVVFAMAMVVAMPAVSAESVEESIKAPNGAPVYTIREIPLSNGEQGKILSSFLHSSEYKTLKHYMLDLGTTPKVSNTTITLYELDGERVINVLVPFQAHGENKTQSISALLDMDYTVVEAAAVQREIESQYGKLSIYTINPIGSHMGEVRVDINIQHLGDIYQIETFRDGSLVDRTETKADYAFMELLQVKRGWTGIKYILSEWETQVVISGLTAGAGVAWLASFLGVPAVIAAALAATSGTLWFIDTLGHNRGVYVFMTWWGTIYVWHN